MGIPLSLTVWSCSAAGLEGTYNVWLENGAAGEKKYYNIKQTFKKVSRHGFADARLFLLCIAVPN